MVTVAVPGDGNLPAALSPFVGRRRNIAEICRLLGTARLLTLTGTGGIGKTRLALEAAGTAARAFNDGVWLVDLAPVLDADAVPGVAAAALGIPNVGAVPVLEQLAAHLYGRRALIVLDNCEHVLDASAALAQALLSAAPQLRILATSRRTLRIVGEYVYKVPALTPDEAVELLLLRSVAVHPEFVLNSTNRDAAVRLCAELDGLPLAIELASARLQSLSLAQLADRVRDRFALLTRGNQTAAPRHRTLCALIAWSYELCTPAERTLWNRLSVFAGGFSLEAAERVCTGGDVAQHKVLDLLDALIAQSVVIVAERDGIPRFKMLETIRQYGMRQLTESGEKLPLRRRHRAYFLALAERTAADWFGPGQAEALAQLRTEHDNLLAALNGPAPEPSAHNPEHAAAFTPDPDDRQKALALAAALHYYWCHGGALADGRRWLDRLLDASPEPTPVRTDTLLAAAWVALLQGDHVAADHRLCEAEKLSDQLGVPLAHIQARGFRGMLALFQAEFATAADLFREALNCLTALSKESETLMWLFQLAIAQMQLHAPDATEICRHALAVATAHGELHGRSYLLWALAFDAWVGGDTEEALRLIRTGLEIQQDFNDYIGSAVLVSLLAWFTGSAGDHLRAVRLEGSAQALWQSIGSSGVTLSPRMAVFRARFEAESMEALGRPGFEKALEEGRHYDNPRSATAFALGMLPDPMRTTAIPSPTPLTRREAEVAALVAEGMSNRQIASALQVSPRTVDGHIANILAKLRFGSRAQIAAWWVTHR
jgi:predicted ATPase/DNA-binding CsgD family transcriptional regulator